MRYKGMTITRWAFCLLLIQAMLWQDRSDADYIDFIAVVNAFNKVHPWL